MTINQTHPTVTAPLTVVTGASSGIGASTARLLADRGHRVALVARCAESLEQVRCTLACSEDSMHIAVPCDVTSAEQVTAAVESIVDQLGVPYGLINAAGVCTPAPLGDLTSSDWNRTLDVNLTGTFLMSQAVSRHMLSTESTASIVNLGSEAATVGMPHYVAYCASKAGVIGLTRAMAAELAPRIRVNALCPGPVDTPMLHAEFALSGDPQQARTAEIARIPTGAIATPDDVADAVVWLLDARTATGSAVALDGGTTVAFYGAADRR